MSNAGRRFAVVFGFLSATIIASGVAGAEPERQGAAQSGTSAMAKSVGQEAANVAGDQYAIEDGSSGGKQTRDPVKRGSGGAGSIAVPDQPSGGQGGSSAVSDDQAIQNADTNKLQQSSSQQSSSQTTSRQVRLQQGVGHSGPSRKRDRQSVSREASGTSGGAEAKARARTVQSPKIRHRVKKLRVAEKAGELPPAATRYGKQGRRQELRIARRKIAARPVDEVSLKRYKKLYEKAAKRYGFGEDWYILAAVGKVESDHGRNMGPSSAGALGPMQFMPSTWESYGLDANKDGKANIMDPEDAIPAAAHYLKVGGAPDDWYKALYSYNHAGWYVEKVLRMAERYRQAAGDNKVGPYYKIRQQ